MLAKLIFAPEAEQDISEAYSWYETRRFSLGEEFLSCVDAGIQKIRRGSELYPVVYEEYRRVLIRRFPYLNFTKTATTPTRVPGHTPA